VNQAGGLKQVNAQYKRYRQAQVAKAEKAIPYTAFLERFVITPTVRNIAMWRIPRGNPRIEKLYIIWE
jgi:hypothetical protein